MPVPRIASGPDNLPHTARPSSRVLLRLPFWSLAIGSQVRAVVRISTSTQHTAQFRDSTDIQVVFKTNSCNAHSVLFPGFVLHTYR